MGELLLELFSEEIPARMQRRAAQDLERLVRDGLAAARLGCDRTQAFVTPRRLAVVAEGLPAAQPETVEERRGPRADAPEDAIAGFLRSVGVDRDQLQRRETPKGTFLFAVVARPGRPAPEVLAAVMQDVIEQLPWPKSMRWGARSERWVRPLHGIVCLFDGTIVPVQFAGIAAGAVTRGHRFLAPAPLTVGGVADYIAKLTAAKVMIDQRQRRALIEERARELAGREGLRVCDDAALFDEVTGLVEWPVGLIGSIDATFMTVPAEVLVTAMRSHQKYFSLLDADGRLAPRFITFANTEAANDGRAVIAGNERVLRARLADAKFFWDQDRKRTLESRVAKLSERVFHARLGSDFDRVHRIVALAREIAPVTGADPGLAARAALLCKADLTTEMVGEFPDLQGVMGRHYAVNDGEPAAVADAIADHYAPQGPGDRCPTAPVSVAVALADKIDTLAGFFGIGDRPTGSKDPFALRRAALGVIRLIVENRLRLPLQPLIVLAVEQHAAGRATAEGGTQLRAAPDVARDLLDFLADRLKVHLREQAVRHDYIGAVFASGAEDDLVRLLARVDALRDFLNTEDGANLLTAFRRARNIVRIEEGKDGISYDGAAEHARLAVPEEIDLHRALSGARRRIGELVGGERYAEAMGVLAALRSPVDAFFDKVTVNCEDPAMRANRLRLLSQIRSALSDVADFSQIEG